MEQLEIMQELNEISKALKEDADSFAKLIAAVVRNKMEDFHGEHLSDKQMGELNSIIRNAIFTALVKYKENPLAMSAYYRCYVPDYWEDCELLDL